MNAIDATLASYDQRKRTVAETQAEIEIELVIEELFGPKGCRLDVINGLLPILNDTAIKTAAALDTNLEVSFLIREEDEAYAGTIQVHVENPTGMSGYHGNSAGQRRLADLIIVFCLTKIAAHGTEFNQAFFDETFEKMDADTRQSMLSALRQLYGDKSSVFIIAHASEGLQNVDQVWHIRDGTIQHIQKLTHDAGTTKLPIAA